MNVLQRLLIAIASIPTVWQWLYAANLLFLFSLLALPIGFKFNFLHLEIARLSPKQVISLALICLISPAMSEELFFRAFILPHPSENPPQIALIVWGTFSLLIFIIYHPLNAISFYRAGRKTFFHPIFLLLAAMLGIICTLSYWQSGSLWPPVVIHWAVVVVWLVFLGGYRSLN